MKSTPFFRRSLLAVVLLGLFVVTLPATIAFAKIDLGGAVIGNVGNLNPPVFLDVPKPMLVGTVFTVNKTADTGDGVCNAADCSLREAIVAANANVGQDTIVFNIGTGLKTIQPTSMLPSITDPVILDATTQPGFSGTPLIEIDGTNAGEVTGLTVNGGNSTIKGLIINGFRQTGLQIFTKGNNLVVGNYIGTNPAGTAAKSNTQNNGIGILINNSPNNVIGGTTAATRNVIAGNKNANGSSGLWIQNATSTGNKVIGNYIGTDVTGTNLIFHTNNAVLLFAGASGNIIGGPNLERNVIAGSPGCTGISLDNVSNNKVMNNLIGLGVQGNSLGIGNAVHIQGNSDNNVIGGTGAGEGNVIASGEKGILNNSDMSTGNSFLGNSIFDNKFGIDLGTNGINANDAGDPDTGPNNLQNFPLITSAIPNGASAQISGTLNSVANVQYRIELFSNTACNSSGNGEGRTFLGATTTTLVGNNGNFNVTVPFDIANKFLTATATDPAGNTSEFSPCFASASIGGTLQFSASSYNIIEGGNASVTIKRIGSAVGAASVQYQTIDGTASTGNDYNTSSGTLNWANGDSSDRTINISTFNDVFDETNEQFSVQLKSPNGAVLGNPATATVTITDDDPTPTISIADIGELEGDQDLRIFTFVVSLSRLSGQNVSVGYSTTAVGTATNGVDYQPTTGSVVIGKGDNAASFSVFVNSDTEDEPNETFVVVLSNPQNATFQDAQATGTILNDDSPVSSTIQFSQGNYNTQEDLGALTITVERTGDTSSTASVDYKTSDNAATQKGDFEYASGKLKFAPGESTKTFVLLVNEDMFVEGSESLNLSLSNPGGAVLGPQSTASVTIADDAPETVSNPIDAAQAFVYTNYHDFLNREPDPGGLAFWTNEIASCGANTQCIDLKRTNVSAAFFLSIEFQETGYLVYKTYKAAYGNVPGTPVPVKLNEFFPDTQEIGKGVVVNQQGWQQVLDNNKNTFMLDFVQRTKFTQQYPTSLHPAQFADQLFLTAGVVPTASQRDGAVSEFGNAPDTTDTAARARALRKVAENPTLAQQEFNRAFVLMQYFGYLRRNPNDAPEAALNFDGYNFWLNKLNQFSGNFGNADMVKAFILSGEYRQRFGQ